MGLDVGLGVKPPLVERAGTVGTMKTLMQAPGRVLVAPSILSADFARMGDECRHVLGSVADGGAGADLLHLDVMDGHFVPNLTMGPDMCRGVRRALPEAFLDVHLMVMEPEKFVEPFAKAGANLFTFHIERHQGKAAVALADRIRAAGMLAGIAVNPPSAVEPVLEVAHAFDLVLVMSVNPGFSGQAFIPEVLEKARRIKPLLKPTQRLEVDGGVSETTAPKCREAGMDVLVAASAIFGKAPADRAAAVRTLRG